MVVLAVLRLTPDRFLFALEAQHALEVLSERLKNSGRTLLLCGARHQPAKMLQRADFIEHIGEHSILPHAEAALQRAREIQAGFTGLGEKVAQDLRKAPL